MFMKRGVNMYSLVSKQKSSYISRHLSELVNPLKGIRSYQVDKSAMVKTLEESGFTSKQAEAITSSITKVHDATLQHVRGTLPKADFGKEMSDKSYRWFREFVLKDNPSTAHLLKYSVGVFVVSYATFYGALSIIHTM